MTEFLGKRVDSSAELSWEEEWHARDSHFEYAVMPPYASGPVVRGAIWDFEGNGRMVNAEQPTHWYAEIRDIAFGMLVWYGYLEDKEAAMRACRDYATGVDDQGDEGLSSGFLENDDELVYVRDPNGKLVYRGTAGYYREVFGFYVDEDFPVHDMRNAVGQETREDGRETIITKPIYRGAGRTEGFTMVVVGPDYLDERAEHKKRRHIPMAYLRSRHEAGLPEYDWYTVQSGHAQFPDDLSKWDHHEADESRRGSLEQYERYEYWSNPPDQQHCTIFRDSSGWMWEKSGGGYAYEGPFDTPEKALGDFVNGSGRFA